MGTLNVANLNHTGNTFTTNANLNFGGSWVDAPVGTIIKRGSYNTGHGVEARTTTASTSWSVINVNGTDQAGFGIGKYSNDGLTFNKISPKSHLEITINFPVYVGGTSGGGGIFCSIGVNGTGGTACLDGGGVPGGGTSSGSEPTIIIENL